MAKSSKPTRIKVEAGYYSIGEVVKDPDYPNHRVEGLGKTWKEDGEEWQYAYLYYDHSLAVPFEKKAGHLR